MTTGFSLWAGEPTPAGRTNNKLRKLGTAQSPEAIAPGAADSDTDEALPQVLSESEEEEGEWDNDEEDLGEDDDADSFHYQGGTVDEEEEYDHY